jgi:hypothetical protein
LSECCNSLIVSSVCIDYRLKAHINVIEDVDEIIVVKVCFKSFFICGGAVNCPGDTGVRLGEDVCKNISRVLDVMYL